MLFVEGGKGYFRDSWSALFFPVKCEMAVFFLVNRDFHSSREAWFCKLFSVKREINVLFAVNRDFHYTFVFRELWKDRFLFRETWSRPPLYHPLRTESRVLWMGSNGVKRRWSMEWPGWLKCVDTGVGLMSWWWFWMERRCSPKRSCSWRFVSPMYCFVHFLHSIR